MSKSQRIRILLVTLALIAIAATGTVKGVFPYPLGFAVLLFIPDEFGVALRKSVPRGLSFFMRHAWKGGFKIR